MTLPQLFTTFDPQSLTLGTVGDGIHLLVKAMLVLGMLFYLIFSIVIIRQIHLMKKTVHTSFSPTVTILGQIHLVLALLVAIYFSFLL